MHKLLLTSPAGYAKRLMKAFEECDTRAQFHPVSRPMIQTDVAIDTSVFHSFFHQLEAYDYLAFSSRKSIEAFALGLQQEGISIPTSLGLCAIGKDNELVRKSLDTEPVFFSSEPSPMGIVRQLENLSSHGKRIAVLAPQVLGMEEPPIVPDFLNGLQQIGMEVTRINAYQTKAATEEVLTSTCAEILQDTYHAVVFTSGTEIKVFLKMIPEDTTLETFLQHLRVICYGPYTARCAVDYGLRVDFTSPAFGSFQEFVSQLTNYYTNQELSLSAEE